LIVLEGIEKEKLQEKNCSLTNKASEV